MNYLERKLAGLCTRGSCKESALDGGQLCARHKKSEAKRRRLGMRKMRAARRAKKQCAYCGQPSKVYACVGCQIRAGRVGSARRQLGVVPTTVATAPTEIEARTWKDAGGRSRYHGQANRGRQANSQLDGQDLKSAKDAIRKAEEGLAMCNSPEVQALPKVQREAAKRAALSQADHGARFLEEVLDRNRYSEDLAAAAPRGRR